MPRRHGQHRESLFSGAHLLPSHQCSPLAMLFLLILRPFLQCAGSSLTDLDVFGYFMIYYVAASVVFASTHFWKTTTVVSVIALVDHYLMY